MKSIALVVIDLLEDYFDATLWPQSQLPGQRKHLVEVTNEMVATFRQAGHPVIWIRQEFEHDLSDAYPHMIRRGVRYTVKGSRGAELLHELDKHTSDDVFIKKRFSAFFETDLHAHLTEKSISTLYLMGITSSWCLRSTAVDAYQLGYDVILVDEGISGFSQDAHENAMSEMNGYIASLMSVADVIEVIQSPSVLPS